MLLLPVCHIIISFWGSACVDRDCKHIGTGGDVAVGVLLFSNGNGKGGVRDGSGACVASGGKEETGGICIMNILMACTSYWYMRACHLD